MTAAGLVLFAANDHLQRYAGPSQARSARRMGSGMTIPLSPWQYLITAL